MVLAVVVLVESMRFARDAGWEVFQRWHVIV